MSAALVGVFFIAMGLVALVVPERVTGTFGMPTLTPEGRNEVRAVYGGFGVALGVLLLATPRLPALREGVLVCAAVALAGMAGGRVLALAVERPRRFYPCGFYLALEALMAAALLAAA
jgi:hypothetical protein